MATGLFDFAANELEQHTDFDRLEARGTLRIALKAAGLTVTSLTPEQLAVVLERVLPDELTSRGIEDTAAVCGAIMASVKDSAAALASPETGGSVDDIFSRLGGD